MTANPVRGVATSREAEGRIQYLTADDEMAVREVLHLEGPMVGRPKLDQARPDLRPLFSVSVHTGLRRSEQCRLEWRDVDFLTGLITVRQSKSGYGRQVPMNSIVRSELTDLADRRAGMDNPEEVVFRCPYVQPDKVFPKAVGRAPGAGAREVAAAINGALAALMAASATVAQRGLEVTARATLAVGDRLDAAEQRLAALLCALAGEIPPTL